MNIQLDPPRVPPLTPSQRSRLRNQVMDRSVTHRQPSRRARWAVPALAVAAVAGIVAGTLVVVHQSDQSVEPPVASTKQVPDAIKLDRGPATAGEVQAALTRCKLPGVQRIEALWSRKVLRTVGTKNQIGVVAVTRSTPAPAGHQADLGLGVCFAAGDSMGIGDAVWGRRPTGAEGMVTLNYPTFDGSGGPGKPLVIEFRAMHRVRPEIRRIQSRVVWSHGSSPWYEGVVEGGLAYTDSSAEVPAGQYSQDLRSKKDPFGTHEEFRAFDQNGKPVPLS